ncbi:ring finger protein 5 [Phtheirospermum japonicum]|uniref:E3 ubiquitin-protein ligase RMA n=1 Tax=Phtheirospermum japonicum TaxID=374723 RepID=A0A830CKV0_9LAMI|nr:ring finger protein 5 [Phtheirospermum japonicum]
MDHRPLPATSFETLLLDRAQELVEERIRQLESVSARERQRRDRNPVEITTIDGINNNTVEIGKSCKRNSSHLVAKALEIDPGSKRPDEETGSFYDCNICFDVAIEPVLTCCGHLFCWACFYQVSNVDVNSKECPVCKGEVSENAVTPIYGNSGGERVDETESGLKIPPRPKAHRVEGVRQQIAVQAVPNIPAEEALRQIMFSIEDGAYNYEAEPRPVGGPRVRVHQVSRVLSESAASLSSLSSALNSAERLVEELETVISNRMAAQNRSARDSTVIQSDEHAALRVDRPSGSTDVSGSDARFLARRTSRRSIMSRNYSDVDGRETRESRRRRLN